jgi:hypothetical protein
VSNPYRPFEDSDNTWSEDEIDSGLDDVDEGYDFEEEPPPPPPRSRLRMVAGWAIAVAVLSAIGFGLLQLGSRYHNPPSRIPSAPAASTAVGIYGTTRPLLNDLQAIQRLVPAGSSLTLDGEVGRIAFPRTVADRLFGKRKEDALIFGAKTDGGNELRVLVLRDDGEPRVIAVDLPSAGDEGLEGLYVGLPPGALQDAFSLLLDQAGSASKETYTSADYTIFGPFEAGNTAKLQERVTANPVLRHQVAAIVADGNDVSLAASAFLIARPPGGNRTINALYQPSTNVVFQPLWGDDATDSLAHELVHAMMDEVVPDEEAAQGQAEDYLVENQPHLYNDIIGDLYQPLDPLGRAEEAIAFITGAVAASQPTTVAPARLLGNQNLLETSAGLLSSDIDFLVGLGILPGCMKPEDLGYGKRTIDFDFYRQVDKACAATP